MKIEKQILLTLFYGANYGANKKPLTIYFLVSG